MSAFTQFADLHCHPHMRSFNWLHNDRKPEKKSKYNPWWIILPKQKAEDEGRRAAAYTQCDMSKVVNGKLNLAFASLYPLEKGWVSGREDSTEQVAKNFKKFLGDNIVNEMLSASVNKLLMFIGNDKKGKLAVRDIIQSIYMKIPLRRVNYVQSGKYDYYKALNQEREYLLKRNGARTSTSLYVPIQKRLFVNKKKLLAENNLDATGEYQIAVSGKNVEEIIKAKKTAFVFTIEGANVFNSFDDFRTIEKKLIEVKNWDTPIFFITFTHHFYNGLAGHAHSIPDVGNLLLDQSEGINGGITPKGEKVLHHLLSVDDAGNYDPAKFGRRILIDVKHLNAKGRKQYFSQFVFPSLKTDHPIPVIASHVAYSGVKTLDELIQRMPEEKDGDFADRYGHKFNNWNINLCDEDVVNIFKSGGLIGLNLDQRVLGLAKDDFDRIEVHANYVWQHIKSMMKAVILSEDESLTSKEKVVDLFCLGTDFDGFIDPINKYPTVLDFEQLADDLLIEIQQDNEKNKLLFGLTPTELVQKICFDNAYQFAIKNFQ